MGSFGRSFSPAKSLSAFDCRGLQNMSPAARGLHAKTKSRDSGGCSLLCDSPCRLLTWCQPRLLRRLSSSQHSRQARSRPWQPRSVGRGWVQTLLWPRCPPVCCLPSGVGTCSKRERVCVCVGGRGQPCVLLPLPDRNQKLTMLGLKKPQPDLAGPVGLPRTDWSLTTA